MSCNNQVRASKAKKVKEDFAKDPNNVTLQQEIEFIKEVCDGNEEIKDEEDNVSEIACLVFECNDGNCLARSWTS